MTEHQKAKDYYLQNRTTLDPKCGKQDGEKITFCSKADGNYCGAYVFPSEKWRLGDCNASDDFLKTTIDDSPAGKKRVGQQKQKKRR